MKANAIKITFAFCLGAGWGSKRQKALEHFMWLRVGHTEMKNIPFLEGPREAGVVVGPPEVHRVCLPSSACVIPGTDCPDEISWLWLCYDVQILHSKLGGRRDT